MLRSLPSAALAAFLLLPLPAPELGAQRTGSEDPRPAAFEVFAGGELEHYLRTLQNVGLADPYPWSLRALSSGEVRGLNVPAEGHPWAHRFQFRPSNERLEYGFVRPRTLTVYNSAFPFGGNDGPMWAGRGLTAAVRAGGYARWGPVSLVVAPVAFRAQNRAFELAPAGSGELGIYRNPLSPGSADIPQRFGPEPYSRIDLGNTTLRIDGAGVALGVSTAAQQWGGSQAHPLVLGPNAGGFPHVFVGTERPLDAWIGVVHARYYAGRLDPSDYVPALREEEMDLRRLMTGVALALRPRGLAGLEVGFNRFVHLEWPERIGLTELRTPFAGMIVPPGERGLPDNELVSVFARWNAPGAGFEIFGEFVRIDHADDTRVFLEEPDDLSGYAMGFRRVWNGAARETDAARLTVVRGEWFSTISSHRQRGGARLGLAERGRPMYRHSRFRQGHTQRGQLLASPAGHGGQGGTLALDRYHAEGRWTVEFERRLERDRRLRPPVDDPADTDVVYALGVEAVRFRGSVDVFVGVRGVYNLNRYLQDDAFNLNLRIGATAAF